ncbi:MAG: PTS cellobiose transporter subunit IIC [Firmicutes bacterium]|jgi:PTS system cellobiose-specific IIC component|nr:PTS cellobiose transporter subunit IIC [Bacillota bacterium]
MSFFDKMEEPIMVIGEKLNNNTILKILRDAFMLAFPLTIFGSITLVIANLPFLDKLLGAERLAILQNMLNPASAVTMSIATVFIVLGIGYYFSKDQKVDALFGAAVALAAFLVLTPLEVITENEEVVSNVFSIDRLGAKSMFVGMFVAFFSAALYCKFVKKNFVIKMPASVPPAVSKSFAALIPAILTLTIFLIVRIIFTFTPWGNIHDFVFQIVQAPLTSLGKGIIPTIIAIFAIQLLWFFGLHEQIIVNSVLDPIWNTLSLENIDAYRAGEMLPNIVTKQFMESFTVSLGGTGMTLVVLIIILTMMKSKQLRGVGKLAAPAGIFNVNEPCIFGLPIVLNPTIAIPWILAPMVSTLVAYLAMATGIVPLTTGVSVPWTVPVFISDILATNSIRGGLLQLVQMAIVGIIWFPFLKTWDKSILKEEAAEQTE